MLRLILENGHGGLVYHPVADEGLRQTDIANAIGAHLGLPTKSITQEEAQAHFGFISYLLATDCPTSSALTQERTGWKPTRPSMLDEMKSGSPLYY
jgi:nucleoside-diphosphate-sugar epimerase